MADLFGGGNRKRDKDKPGPASGGYTAKDIELVAAFVLGDNPVVLVLAGTTYGPAEPTLLEQLRSAQAACPDCQQFKGEPTTLKPGTSVLFKGDEQVGLVTSGGYGYRLKQSIALAYVRTDLAKPGMALDVEIFGERRRAVVAQEPLYDPTNARLRM